MKSDLVDRYIYAVTKNLPSKAKEDIKNELYTLIEDMLESRCGENSPSEHDIRVVLTELGTPSQLAEKYNPDSDKYLIGPQYYAKYKFLLSIILLATGAGLLIAGIVTAIIDTEAVWYFVIPSTIGMILMGLFNAFAFVTILFAIFQRRGVDVKVGTDSLDNLPPVPDKGESISKNESIFGIVFSVIFCTVFLLAPQILNVPFIEGNRFIPVFDVDMIRSVWYIIIAFSALGIIRESYKIYEGRYTRRLAIVTIVTDFLSAILSLIFLLNSNILNSEFIASLTKLFKDEELILNIFSRFNIFFLCVILFALALDMGVTIMRTLRYERVI